MNTMLLGDLVQDQRDAFLARSPGVSREVDIAAHLKHGRVVVISGIRRCGKSTLLRQIAERFRKKDFHYLNLDDERLFEFEISDFDRLMQVFHKRAESRVLLFDEIQNVPGWERFVRRIHDEGYKVILTGSNARLLSSEQGTHLTGRYSRINLYPFSLRETLLFHRINPRALKAKSRPRALRVFDEYLGHGGFPEYLKFKNRELLQRTYEDILFRDIIARFKIREGKALQHLAHYLCTNFTGEISYHSLKNILHIKSAVSVRNHIAFLEQAYLLFEVFKYDFSLKKQHVSNKKVYVVDTGLRNAVSFQFSRDAGKALENCVFVELLRRGENVYFFRDRGECDFVTVSGRKAVSAIQVCFELHEGNRKREIGGLQEALETLRISNGLLLTYDQYEEIALESGAAIRVMPVWRWLLGAS
jgi:predicted AAA+ superfamily ATPase